MRTAAVLYAAIAILAWSPPGAAAQWRVGLARIDVTPTQKLWMAGYAARKHPAEGTIHPLWAKALAIEDQQGRRVVIVTADLIGDNFGRQMSEAIGAAAARRTGVPRDRILVNFSHTHCGPVVRISDGARVTYGMNNEQQADVRAYTRRLEDKLVSLIQQACSRLQPADLAYGEGKATFAANRRLRYNPKGPVDHSVPVLRVTAGDGRLLAVVFGYACHNTTLGADCYRYNGDYAGFAQIELESRHRPAAAMFMAGCGGDINPAPRGTVELARRHGRALAEAVQKVLRGDLVPLPGPLVVAFQRVELPFVDPPTRDELLRRRGQGDVYDQRLTEVLLERLERHGKLETAYPCPVQVIRFGRDLALVALGGEVVVDYALRLRRELADQRLWVTGYSNEVFAYVPSERVLAEGGYEAEGAMRYFGWHGPFRPGVERRLVDTVKTLMAETQSALENPPAGTGRKNAVQPAADPMRQGLSQ